MAKQTCEVLTTSEGRSSDHTVTTTDGTSFRFESPTQPEMGTSTAAYWTIYYHKTFIPDAQVSTGLVCGTFKGDSRSWSAANSGSNSRTFANMRADWTNRVVHTVKSVGATHRLAANGYPAATATASSAGIQFVGASATATYLEYSRGLVSGRPVES